MRVLVFSLSTLNTTTRGRAGAGGRPKEGRRMRDCEDDSMISRNDTIETRQLVCFLSCDAGATPRTKIRNREKLSRTPTALIMYRVVACGAHIPQAWSVVSRRAHNPLTMFHSHHDVPTCPFCTIPGRHHGTRYISSSSDPLKIDAQASTPEAGPQRAPTKTC